MASEKIPPCEIYFEKMKIGTKWWVVPKLIFDQKFEISFLMLKWVIVRYIGPKTFRFSQNKVVNMKNRPGKNSALERLEISVFSHQRTCPKAFRIEFFRENGVFFPWKIFWPFLKVFSIIGKNIRSFGEKCAYTYRLFLVPNCRKIKNFDFLKKFFKIFQKNLFTSAWKFFFFTNFKSINSQLSYALSSAQKY